jgi:hypothetical protein
MAPSKPTSKIRLARTVRPSSISKGIRTAASPATRSRPRRGFHSSCALAGEPSPEPPDERSIPSRGSRVADRRLGAVARNEAATPWPRRDICLGCSHFHATQRLSAYGIV